MKAAMRATLRQNCRAGLVFRAVVSYIFAMSARIAVECLTCGHCGSLAERDLPRFGLHEDTSLVLVTRRLVCQECGGRSVRAFRYDPDSPPIVPEPAAEN